MRVRFFSAKEAAIKTVGDLDVSWTGILLHGKLQPPELNADAVTRDALIARLDRRRSRLLSLLHSPAGFGKTTLLAQFHRHLESGGDGVAWLSLDEDDRDPQRFVAYLTHAVARAAGGAPGAAEAQTLAALLNMLATAGPPVFVLIDDYHLAQTTRNDRIVEWLIRHRPARLRLVVAMRGRPGFPTSRLRVEGQLFELDEADLRFGIDEGRGLFGQEFDAAGVDAILERTEGWPVALQLARLWAGRHPGMPPLFPDFTGGASEVAAYLAEEVVSTLPEESRDLLLSTAIVRELPVDLARHLTDGRASRATLGALVDLNVPIFAVPGRDDLFRYHPIFREFLEAQLAVSPRHEKGALHRRASEWFEARGLIPDAIEQAVASGDEARAIRLAETTSWVGRISRGRSGDARRVLDALGEDAARRIPRLAAARAFLKHKEGATKAASRMVEEIAAMFPPGPGRAALERGTAQDLQLLDALHTAYIDRGVAPATIRALEAWLDGADPADHACRGTLTTTLGLLHFRDGRLSDARAAFLASMEEFERGDNRYGTVFLPIHLAMIAMARGKLGEARSWIDGGARTIRTHFSFDPALRHQLDLIAAEQFYLSNDLDRARGRLAAAMAAIEGTEGWTELYISAYRTMAALALLDHGNDAARGVLDEGDAAAARVDFPRLSFNLAARRVQLLLSAGEIAEAKRVADASDLSGIAAGRHDPVTSWIERDEAALGLVRLAIARDDPAGALERLGPLEQAAVERGAGLRRIQCEVLKAIAHRKAGDAALATPVLRDALASAMEEGMVAPFLEEGPAVRAMLTELVAHVGVGAMTGALYDWISRLLIAIDDADAGEAAQGGIASIFTPTEWSVLRELIETGGSNKEIARRLSTTDNTVKFHMKNIFRKLGVNTRRLAIEVTRQRRLLS